MYGCSLCFSSLSLSVLVVSVFLPCDFLSISLSLSLSLLSCLSLCLVCICVLFPRHTIVALTSRRVLRYLELLRCDAVRGYRSAEDRYCGERCKMCASPVVFVLLVCLPFGGLLCCSTWIMKRSRTRLGRVSSSSWRSDSRVTWSLDSRPSSRGRSRISRCLLSRGGGMGAFRAVWSWSISVARLTRLPTLTVVWCSEPRSMG